MIVEEEPARIELSPRELNRFRATPGFRELVTMIAFALIQKTRCGSVQLASLNPRTDRVTPIGHLRRDERSWRLRQLELF